MSTLLQGLAPTRVALENGAVVLAQGTATHPAVTLLVAVRAGSGHDPAERVGLAHFVSKVIDRGTALRSADEVAEALDGRGVSLNSSVGRHLLTLGCTCLAEDFGDMLERHGLLLVLLSIFAGGLALNLTPCVYPVIPLTVGYFGRQSSGSKGRLFALAAIYVLGMATMYSILGVVAALSGRLFGSMLQNPWVLTAIAAALVAMALSMFGIWEIRMPTALMNRAGARAGVAGAYGMGLFVGVVAAPCIGGFIVGLLAFVAARQDPYLGFLFFFVLSLGLGLPYLFLAAYSGRLARLPRAGEWMEGVKKIFGWILLAMAAYFLRSVVPPPLGKWLLPLVLVIGAVAILVTRLGLRWPIKAGAAVVLIGIAIFFVPRELKGWQPYAADVVGAGRPAVIDFSADWCLPCLELEKKTFSDPRVAEALSRRALLKADMTKIGSPEAVALAERFGILGVPTVIFLDGSGKERQDLRLVGFENAERFLERLSKAP